MHLKKYLAREQHSLTHRYQVNLLQEKDSLEYSTFGGFLALPVLSQGQRKAV